LFRIHFIRLFRFRSYREVSLLFSMGRPSETIYKRDLILILSHLIRRIFKRLNGIPCYKIFNTFTQFYTFLRRDFLEAREGIFRSKTHWFYDPDTIVFFVKFSNVCVICSESPQRQGDYIARTLAVNDLSHKKWIQHLPHYRERVNVYTKHIMFISSKLLIFFKPISTKTEIIISNNKRTRIVKIKTLYKMNMTCDNVFLVIIVM